MNKNGVPRRLLHYLKKELKNSNLVFKRFPIKIGQGYETYIYKFQLENTVIEHSKPLVLRLYPENIENKVQKEHLIQNFLKENNYPVPKVHLFCGDRTILGGEFLVMEYLQGKTMEDSIASHESPILLADTHVELHKIQTEKLVETLTKSSVPSEWYDGTIWSDTRAANIPWLRPGIDWIKNNEPKINQNVLCHGDFHRTNVLVKGKTISGVLDWGDSHLGEPEKDVAYTLLVLTAWDPLVPSECISSRDADTYLDHYRSIGKLDMSKIDYYKAVNCISYLEWVNIGGTQAIPKRVINNLLDCFKEITGVIINPQ